MLFPDQIVVLGRRPLFVPYVDPGLALARRVRDELETHVARHGEPPKVIYLGNHGLFALGRRPSTCCRSPRWRSRRAACSPGRSRSGGVSALADAEADRIDARPDEHYRRAALARARTGETGDA